MKIRLLLILLLFCPVCNLAFARANDPADFVTAFKLGSVTVDNGTFITGDDGQCYIEKKEYLEFRLKQNTSVNLTNNPFAFIDEVELKQGLMGIKTVSDTLLVKTPHTDVRVRNALVVIKVTEFMTRVCVIKGTAYLMLNTNIVSVEAGKEIAACKDHFSKQYKYLDDLRYIWYWVSPDKEPSLEEE